MVPVVCCFKFPASCTWLGDFILAHASGNKCELVILLHSRVLIRDQMAIRSYVGVGKAGVKAFLAVE